MESPVLVVQNSATPRSGYDSLIKNALGYDVITASSAIQAKSMLKAGVRPCLIVLDLPDKDDSTVGLRVEQLGDPALVQCPVIVCADRLDSGFCLERLSTRVFLAKPIDPDTLLRVVSNVCADSQLN